MKSKRLALKVEPLLKPMHRYIVQIIKDETGKTCKFHYCANRAEVRKLKEAQKKKCVFLVFKAEHNFTSGWLLE